MFWKFRKCNLGEPLLSCLKAEREVIDSCKAGSAADVEIACNFKVWFSVDSIVDLPIMDFNLWSRR
jgi:hypothetical protein